MSDSTLIGQIPEVTKQSLSRLPGVLSDELIERLLQCVHYEPVIGIIGKSGAGKSSLCNTLFSSPPASIDAVKRCTRRAQQYKTSDGLRALNIINFPGIGETPTLDKMYVRLYQHWLNMLDLIVWVLKADDRAWNDDTRQLEPKYGTEKVTTTAQGGFSRVVENLFDESVEALLTSYTLRQWLKQVRYRLLSLAKLLWHRFF